MKISIACVEKVYYHPHSYIDIPPPSSSQVTLLISYGLFGFNGETGKQGVVKNACSYIRFRHHLVYFIHWKRSLRDFDAPMTLGLWGTVLCYRMWRDVFFFVNICAIWIKLVQNMYIHVNSVRNRKNLNLYLLTLDHHTRLSMVHFPHWHYDQRPNLWIIWSEFTLPTFAGKGTLLSRRREVLDRPH